MRKPNVLLFLTDQQRWDTIAAAGNPYIKTPNLDRLVEEGTLFSSAYTPSPVCVPARCSLHYGQYPMNTGCFENTDNMPDDWASVADVLTAAGYCTHAIGKRHFTPDRQARRGFQTLESQEESVVDASHDDYLQYLKARDCEYAIEPHGVRGEAYYVPQLSPVPPQHHPTQWVGDRSVEWLKAQAGKSEPFFLFSSFIHPHPPFAPPTPWHKLYRAPDMPLPKMPEDPESLYTFINRFQNRMKGRDNGRDVNLIRLMKAYYWASISFVDYQVGRILQTLEDLGELDNTLIVFTSDHGEFLGDYNCFGKRSFLDASARIPLICRLPGVFAAGDVCNTPVSLIDVMPTALSVAGTGADELDGENLADIAAANSSRDMVFGHWRYHKDERAGVYMAVSDEWKYIWSAADNKEFLFNRIKNPEETRNQAHHLSCSSALTEMRTMLQAHMRTMPGHDHDLNEDGWIVKNPVLLPPDPDAELMRQDPPCFLDRMVISGYTQ